MQVSLSIPSAEAVPELPEPEDGQVGHDARLGRRARRLVLRVPAQGAARRQEIAHEFFTQ